MKVWIVSGHYGYYEDRGSVILMTTNNETKAKEIKEKIARFDNITEQIREFLGLGKIGTSVELTEINENLGDAFAQHEFNARSLNGYHSFGISEQEVSS